MNVGEILGLEGNSLLLTDARRRWSEWQGADARLLAVPEYDDLQARMRELRPGAADAVRLALAELAASDGGDDAAAAAALASTLLPGATVLAARLTSLASAHCVTGGPRALVHELVASQLWIEVRSFPWRRLTKVGGNVLMNCRAAVMRELGDFHQLDRGDRTWARTDFVDENALDAALHGGAVADGDSDPLGWVVGELLTPAGEVEVVLDWACENRVLSEDDRQLILMLLEHAPTAGVRETTRGRANLCGGRLAEQVAPLIGVSPATVRRRASTSVQALIDAVPPGVCA